MSSTHEWIKKTWDIFVVVWSLSLIRCFATPWTIAQQASLSMGFSRQKYWSGLAFPSPEDHPDPGIEPTSSALQVDSLLLRHQGSLLYVYICVCVCVCVCVGLSATPWTVAHQAPLSMGFPSQRYWSGLTFPTAGDLPDPRIKPMSPVSPELQAHSLPVEPFGKPIYIWKPIYIYEIFSHKKNEFLPFTTIWMGLESVMLSEINQRKILCYQSCVESKAELRECI